MPSLNVETLQQIYFCAKSLYFFVNNSKISFTIFKIANYRLQLFHTTHNLNFDLEEVSKSTLQATDFDA